MTRPEISGTRSLAFSAWCKLKLPDSETGFCVANLDWIFWNWKTRQLVICEEKCFKAKLAPYFKRLMAEIFSPALEAFCKMNGVKFGGFVVVQFEKTCPTDGKTWVNGKAVSEAKLIDILTAKGK